MPEFMTSGLAGANTALTHTTAQFDLGTVSLGTSGRRYMYVLASGAISRYDVVTVDSSYVARPLMKAQADLGYRIAVAADTALADAEYGWVVIAAPFVLANCKANTNAAVALFTSDTTGKLAHVSASQTEIKSVTALATSGATATATVVSFNTPFVDIV